MKKCTECNKPRLFISKHVLPGQEQRKLSKSLKDMDDFCCQRDLSDILTDTMKSKNLMLETRSCTDPVWALYYRMEDYVPVCAFCGENLNEENIKKLREIQKSSDCNVKRST